MKIKLVNATKLFNETFPPYGLALINTFLSKNSIKSSIFDLDIVVKHHNSLGKEPLFVDRDYLRKNYSKIYDVLKGNAADEYLELQFDKMLEKINLKGFDVVGINNHDNEIYISLYLAKKIKEKQDCTIVIGGTQVRRMDANRLRCFIADLNIKYVDFFVKHNPYDFFLKMDKYKTATKPDKPEVHEKERDWSDMNNYAIPLYNKEHLELYKTDMSKIHFYYKLSDPLLAKFKDLKSVKNCKPLLILPYKFMEGCTNNCAFCFTHKNTFKLDIDTVLTNIKAMGKQYNCKNFYFLNNNIIMDKKYAASLFKQMSEEINIRWCDSISIRGVNPSTAKSMAGSGCIQLLFGLESASPKLLKYTNKNRGYNDLKHYMRCFKTCDKNSIWVIIDLIAGLPYETMEDIKQTMNFLEKNRDIINGIFVNRFTLLKKSTFSNNPDSYKLRILNDDSVVKKMKSESSKESDFYYKNYRTLFFDETEGLNWEAKQKQIDQSSKMLRAYVSEKFKTHFYSHYPIFLLYEAFQDNKKEIIKFLNA